MSFGRGNAGEKFIDANSKALGLFYARAYNKLVEELKNASGSLHLPSRQKILLSRVDTIISTLDKETKTFVETIIPKTYRAFGEATRNDIRSLGTKVPKQFSKVHTEAVEALADKTYLAFGNTLQGVKKDVQNYVAIARQKDVQARLAEARILGQAEIDVAKDVKDIVAEGGITSLVDKAGKKWQLDRYATMLTRTQLAQTSRAGVANNALEFGFDLVMITTHGAEDRCKEWEGKVLSLTGATKGYQTVDEAQAIHLFHPNCRHSFFVLSPDDIKDEWKDVPKK